MMKFFWPLILVLCAASLWAGDFYIAPFVGGDVVHSIDVVVNRNVPEAERTFSIISGDSTVYTYDVAASSKALGPLNAPVLGLAMGWRQFEASASFASFSSDYDYFYGILTEVDSAAVGREFQYEQKIKLTPIDVSLLYYFYQKGDNYIALGGGASFLSGKMTSNYLGVSRGDEFSQTGYHALLRAHFPLFQKARLQFQLKKRFNCDLITETQFVAADYEDITTVIDGSTRIENDIDLNTFSFSLSVRLDLGF